MPTTTTSAGSTVPDEVSTDPTWPAASPWNSAAVSPKRNSTPCASCSAGEDAAELRAERAVAAASGCGSTTVTGQPAMLAAAAVSRPIQPEPTITTRPSGVNAARSASDSGSFRRLQDAVEASPGMSSCRGAAPVASSSLS